MFSSIRKRVSAFLLVLLMLMMLMIGCLSGCRRKDDTLSVMIPLQKDSFDSFFALFSESNPDVEFVKTAYRGGSPSAYLQSRFEINDLTDIVITSYPPSGDIQKETLLDLSGFDFVHNYKANVLANASVDGKIYLLECPSSVRGIAYNKTLFAENEWEVPTNHDEFIALLKQIGEDADIMPLGIQGKYPGAYFTLMSELSHCDFLQTPAGAEWEQRFAKGQASSEEGFASGLRLLQEWQEAGAFDSEQKTLGDSTLYQLFVERGCAMTYVMGSQNKLVELTDASSDEFGMFPIYGEGEDSEFVATTYGLKIGLNKSLGEPGNEKKLKKALALMEFLSTENGQMAFHTGRGDILPLVGTSSTLADIFQGVSSAIDRGHAAPFLYPGYEDVLPLGGEYLRQAFYSDDPVTGVFALMDEVRRDSLNNKSNYLATVSETLDEDQTAQFVANALHAQGYGDFALISKGGYSEHFDVAGGANGKLYKGGIVTMAVNAPITNLNAQCAVTMTLTGAQVKTLLAQGRVLSDDKGHTDSFPYVAAGITVERNKDGSVKSVYFGGSPLEDTKVYTVAFSPQDYSEAVAQIGNPQSTETPWQDAYRAYIVGLGVITPNHAKQA